jgi:hypothetical protein
MSVPSIIPILAAVIAKREREIINYLNDKNAKDKDSAVVIEDERIKNNLLKYNYKLYCIKSEGEKYWIDKELYQKYQREKKMLIILGILVVLILMLLILLIGSDALLRK